MKKLLIIFICCFIYKATFSQDNLNINIKNNPKSESTAFSYSAISIVTTILPGILIANNNGDVNTTSGILLASGYLFAPGAGHLYADNTKEFFSGAGIRLSGVIIFLIGASNVDIMGSNGDDHAAAVGILGGMAVGLFGIIHDLATVDNSVREYNNKLNNMSYSLKPILYNQNDNLTAGLRFKITK